MTARISQLAVCAIVSGTGAAVRRATTLLDGHAPHVLLATVRDRGRGDPTAFLFSDANAADFPESADAHVIALAVPKARLGRSRLAPVTELDDTPLLRAGQALLKSLAADLAHGDVLGVPEFDDLLVSLVRGVVQRHPVTDQRAAADAVMRQRLTDLIEARYTDPSLDVARIARELFVSRRQLYRHTPDGVGHLLARRRVEAATELLSSQPDLTINEIAHACGFTSASRLRAQFQVFMGQTPAQYRMRDAPRIL